MWVEEVSIGSRINLTKSAIRFITFEVKEEMEMKISRILESQVVQMLQT